MKARPLELAPPGLTTVTVAAPATAMSDDAIAAVSCDELTNVVVRFEPFQRTTAPVRKLPPLTVSVKLAPPAVVVLGLSVLALGVSAATIALETGVDVVVPPAFVADSLRRML